MATAGFLSTALDTTGERLKERIEQTNQMDKEMRDTQTQALINSIYAVDENGNPKLSPAEAEDAWNQVTKLHSHNKMAKDIIGKAKDITQQILGHGAPKNQAMGSRVAQQTSDTLNGGQGGNLVQPPAAPAAAAPTGGESATPPAMPMTPPPPGQTKQPVQQVASAASAQPAAAQAGPTPPPQRSMAAIMQAGSPVAQDINKVKITNEAQAKKGADIAEAQRKAQLDYDLDLDRRRRKDREDEGRRIGLSGVQLAQYVQGSGSIATKPFNFPTAQSGQTVTEMLRANGRPETDIAGQAIDPQAFYNVRDTGTGAEGMAVTKELPDYGGFPQFAIRDSDKHWVAIQRDRKGHYPVKITDDLGVTPPAGMEHISTAEIPTLDADGNLNLVTTNRTTKPVAPGGEAAAPASTTAPPPAKPGPTSQVTPPGAGGVKSRVVLGLLPPAEYNSQMAIARPVRSAATQLLGLEPYAHLADDPKSKDKIGTAIRMILEDSTKAEKSGGLGASALGEGIALNGGDLWQAIKNKTGITQAVASTEAGALQNALSSLSPEEAEYISHVLASIGTVPGLRATTKGGAYKSSIDAIEREIPIIGVNVGDSKTFSGKLGLTFKEINAGLMGVNQSLLPESKDWKEAQARLESKGRGNLTPPPSRNSGSTNSGGTRVVGNTTYYKHKDGKWYTAAEK